MAEFIEKQPVTTADPFVEVTLSAEKALPVGVHRFQLIVTDDSGNVSAPQVLEVIVRDSVAPTAVIDFASTDGKPVEKPVADFGQSFGLSGTRSSDVAPGKVVSYEWTLLPADISRPVPTPSPFIRRPVG